MLSIDLFDSKFERRLHEGAVDDAEYARFKTLGEKIDYLRQARAKTKDPEMRKAIDGRIKQYDDERREILSVRDMKEAGQPTQPPAKGLLKGKDLVTPQQRVAAATPPQTGMLGKAKETLGSFANWLAGRDDTGPTYEAALKENDPNSAINAAKFAYEQIRKAHDTNVDTATIRWLNNNEPVTMSRNQLYHTVQKLKAMSRQNRNAFAIQTLADRNNFSLWLGSQKRVTPRPQLKQPTDPFQPELPLGKPKIGPVQERVQKKKSDDIQARDVKVARELQKLRALYPAARSDVEAVARAEIDSTERSNQQISAIRGANEKQDALLRQLVALDREQGREIDSLDSENNNLERQLAQIQATNNRLQKTIGQMTGTKRSSRQDKSATTQAPTAATTVTTVPASAEIDPETVKKLQDLETQIGQLQARPSTPDVEKKINALQSRINALPAQAAQALNIDQDKKSTSKVPRLQVPAGDLDIEPAKKTPTKRKTTKAKPAKVSQPKATVPDNLNILDIEEPDMFAVTEHGGGIGPRQHWQSLMRETGRPPMDTLNYYFPDINAQSDVEAIRGAIKQIVNNPELSKTSKQRLLGQVGMMVQRNRAMIGREWRQYLDRFTESDEQLLEGIKDAAGATAVVACLLAGGSLQGCATNSQQTTAQQVLKTGQDAGRLAQAAGKITRAGTEEEVRQELKNFARATAGDPGAANTSNILRLWKYFTIPRPKPPQQAEPPEYGPPPPTPRMPQYEAKEIVSKEDFVRERDRLLRMIAAETNPANKQILRSAIRQLEGRAENEGWITIQQRMVREDTASKAAEQAILKRIMVAHTDLLRQFGPQKVMQAAEEVAYNVGDIAEIGSSDVSGWVKQVEQILGAHA